VMETSSALLAPSLWESKTMLEETIRTLRPFCTDESLDWVREHGTVMPLGVDCIALDEVRAARQVDRQPRLFWGGTITQAVKGWRTSREVLARASAISGAPVLMTTMNENNGEVPDQFEAYYEQNRLGFYEQMKRGDVFVCNCGFESYGMAWLEMLGAGLLGVFKDAFWLKYVLPDWYPFVVSSEEEQAQVAAALIKQWPDGPLWKYSDMIAEYVREEHNQWIGGVRMVESIRKWIG